MSERITVAEVDDFLARSRKQLSAGQGRFDLSSIGQVDSTAVAALLALKRDGQCSFENPPPNLKKLADLYGVSTLLFEH